MAITLVAPFVLRISADGALQYCGRYAPRARVRAPEVVHKKAERDGVRLERENACVREQARQQERRHA
jgi:hypothetical protein